jgi:hypothetical protein
MGEAIDAWLWQFAVPAQASALTDLGPMNRDITDRDARNAVEIG